MGSRARSLTHEANRRDGPQCRPHNDRPADNRVRALVERRPPRADVVAGSGAHLSDETRSLLRIRLRAVSLAMSCAFGAFLVRDIWLAGHYRDPIIAGFHCFVVAAFVSSFVVLSGQRPIAMRRLRAWSFFCSG